MYNKDDITGALIECKLSADDTTLNPGNANPGFTAFINEIKKIGTHTIYSTEGYETITNIFLREDIFDNTLDGLIRIYHYLETNKSSEYNKMTLAEAYRNIYSSSILDEVGELSMALHPNNDISPNAEDVLYELITLLAIYH